MKVKRNIKLTVWASNVKDIIDLFIKDCDYDYVIVSLSDDENYYEVESHRVEEKQ